MKKKIRMVSNLPAAIKTIQYQEEEAFTKMFCGNYRLLKKEGYSHMIKWETLWISNEHLVTEIQVWN
jgi:hypothetical protein